MTKNRTQKGHFNATPSIVIPGAPTPVLPDALVMIGIPSGSTWEADFGMSMLSLIAHSSGRTPENYASLACAVNNVKGSILPQSRQQLVRKAQEMKATHILFLDSDMTFPGWSLIKLLELGVDVAAANCVTKSIPPNPTARFKGDTPDGEVVYHYDYVEEGGPDTVDVWRVGTGVMLIDMKVFDRIEKPWFPIEYDGERLVGEDWGFCKKCEEAGIKLTVDVELSMSIGHIGRLEFNCTMMADKGHYQ
jgi:hypothetical protein